MSKSLPDDFQQLADGSIVVNDQKNLRYDRKESAKPHPTTKSELGSFSDLRTETERDRARIGYSAYLRRLAGVTQVVSPDLTSSRLHTRASHTHKVALVSREIAEHLIRRAVAGDQEVIDAIRKSGGLDIAACEAAGLAHDLGHPPFGHAGEEELDRLLLQRGQTDGFEGNAQSFRIVTVLDSYKSDRAGLNLTNVTLAAILKYPWLRNIDGVGTKSEGSNRRHQKFSAYRSEIDQLRSVRNALFPGNAEVEYPASKSAPPMQSLEASIMDLADDIAYSIHDLEDFLSAGVIRVDRATVDLDVAHRHYTVKPTEASNVFIAAETKLRAYEGDLFDPAEYGKALGKIMGLLRTYGAAAPATPQTELELALRTLLSGKVSEFFSAIDVGEFKSGRKVRLLSTSWHEMQVMKYVTKRQLVLTAKMGVIQQAQTQVIRNLFTGLEDWLLCVDEKSALPEPLQEFLDNLNAEVPFTAVPFEFAGPSDLLQTLQPRPASSQAIEVVKSEEKVVVRTLSPEHYRAIVDYICGMSDSEALLRSQWLTGSEVPGMSSLGVLH